MKTIFKYQIAITGAPQDVLMSEGAVILKAMVQRGDLFLWAMVDQDGGPEDRTIRMFGTGETIDDHPRVYIDTVMLRNDSLVLHIFEEPKNVAKCNVCGTTENLRIEHGWRKGYRCDSDGCISF